MLFIEFYQRSADAIRQQFINFPNALCSVETLYLPRPLEELSKEELSAKEANLTITTGVLREMIEFFVNKGFKWALPVLISKSTDPLWPDPGASIEKRLEFDVYEEKVRTTLSMIIHKLVACSLVTEKFFIISPNIRIEKRERKSTGWHAYEFHQLDFEVRNASSNQIMDTVEELIINLFQSLNEKLSQLLKSSKNYDLMKSVDRPFEIYNRIDLVRKFGENWEKELPRTITQPVWVTNIPREFYDYQDIEHDSWDNFDLYLPRSGEVLSGARREWQYDKILQKMERDGVRKENYSVLLKLAKEGKLKPTAGAGIGIERIIAWISGSKHLCDIQLFPRIPGIVYEL